MVIFGAVSLIQQAKQANEDKALRLKAINTHNSFLSQEEDTSNEPQVHPAASLVLNSNGADSSPSTSQSSDDEPDTAAPAMLDQPDRPEPGMPQPPHSSSADQSSKDKSSSHLPPQTAVLDRPERPEPDSASLDSAAAAQSDMTTQQTEPAFSSFMASEQMPDRPYSPRTNEQACHKPLLLKCDCSKLQYVMWKICIGHHCSRTDVPAFQVYDCHGYTSVHSIALSDLVARWLSHMLSSSVLFGCEYVQGSVINSSRNTHESISTLKSQSCVLAAASTLTLSWTMGNLLMLIGSHMTVSGVVVEGGSAASRVRSENEQLEGVEGDCTPTH